MCCSSPAGGEGVDAGRGPPRRSPSSVGGDSVGLSCFRAAPLQDRELLYICVPSELDGRVMIAYLSVCGASHPVTSGHSRARNLMPSFDLATPMSEGGLRIRGADRTPPQARNEMQPGRIRIRS